MYRVIDIKNDGHIVKQVIYKEDKKLEDAFIQGNYFISKVSK